MSGAVAAWACAARLIISFVGVAILAAVLPTVYSNLNLNSHVKSAARGAPVAHGDALRRRRRRRLLGLRRLDAAGAADAHAPDRGRRSGRDDPRPARQTSSSPCRRRARREAAPSRPSRITVERRPGRRGVGGPVGRQAAQPGRDTAHAAARPHAPASPASRLPAVALVVALYLAWSLSNPLRRIRAGAERMRGGRARHARQGRRRRGDEGRRPRPEQPGRDAAARGGPAQGERRRPCARAAHAGHGPAGAHRGGAGRRVQRPVGQSRRHARRGPAPVAACSTTSRRSPTPSAPACCSSAARSTSPRWQRGRPPPWRTSSRKKGIDVHDRARARRRRRRRRPPAADPRQSALQRAALHRRRRARDGAHVRRRGRAPSSRSRTPASASPTGDLDHVFERFWRGEKSRSRSTGGAGIGLAVVKGLAQAHGGDVRVTSAPGEGSTFRVRPAERLSAAVDDARHSGPLPSRPYDESRSRSTRPALSTRCRCSRPKAPLIVAALLHTVFTPTRPLDLAFGRLQEVRECRASHAIAAAKPP